MRLSKMYIYYIGLIICLSLACNGCYTHHENKVLTKEEQTWLNEHDHKIVLGHDPSAKPFEFTDESGEFRGIAADYVHLLEKKLNFNFKIVDLKSWDDVVQKARKREIDVLCAFTKNPEREQWMRFTEPYIEVPTVILARIGNTQNLSLQNMKGMKVTFTKGWIVDDFLHTNYKDLNFIPAVDAKTAMNNLTTGQADAWITAITVASNQIEQSRVTSLRIAGETPLTFKLGFASRKDWPILNQILDKGLKLITPKEHEAIFNKWIHIQSPSIFKNKNFWIGTIIIISVFLSSIIFVMIWNKSLKSEVQKQTQALKHELDERKKAEERIGFQAKLLESVGQAVIATDTSGTITYWNKIAEQLYGWPAQEVLGQNISVMDNHSNSTKQVTDILCHLSDGNPTSGEFQFNRKDGANIPIWVSNTPIFDQEGNLSGTVGISMDISKTKELEALLQQTQKMEAVSSLAGGIAHDFNNILGVILGNISYALHTMPKDIIQNSEDLYEALTDVEKGARQAQTLTQQLLTFARGGEPIKQSINLNNLIEETARFVTRGSNCRCELDLDKNLANAEVDKGQLNQAISNIIINAVQAMPEGGIIEIKTQNSVAQFPASEGLSSKRNIHIQISDQGMGISKNYIHKIFDPFFTTKHKGNGLGLATAFSIIKRHSGKMSVDSQIEVGTTFHIYLPASANGEHEQQVEKITIHKGQGKILVMDDQEYILKMIGRMLNEMGYETVFCTEGSMAIDLYRQAHETPAPFDLVILDLTIPGGLGGAKVIGELLKIDPNVKAIVSSGYSNDPIMANYEDYGFCGVVQKPYTKQQIAQILEKTLA